MQGDLKHCPPKSKNRQKKIVNSIYIDTIDYKVMTAALKLTVNKENIM